MRPSVPLFDNAALRRLEAAAAGACGDSFALMQRAGLAAWRMLLARWPQAMRIVVACGPGHNGADGYVLARHALDAGRRISVLRPYAPRTGLARRACDEFVAAGGHCSESLELLADADVVVDAVFGIGLSRPADGVWAALIEAINASPAGVFALDVPSGVDAGTGNVAGLAVRAQATLQMLGAHAGLVTGAAIDHCGVLLVDALGLTPGDAMASALAIDASALHAWLGPRSRDSHKGNNGQVLCVGGDLGAGGAIVLAAQAALRSGAGVVRVATRPEHVAALLAKQPEAMAHAVCDAGSLAPLCTHSDCIAIGPGLGTGAWGASLWAAVLDCAKPLVIDADALNLLAGMRRALPADSVLTPHPGEAARLLGCSSADIQRDRHAAARSLVDRYACVVVLKGAGTIVAAPGHTPFVVIAGNPGMAAGGMGDLLTGVVAALRAQGMPAFDAAACGALLHAVAGDDAARDGGERGMLPSDLLLPLRRRANPGAGR